MALSTLRGTRHTASALRRGTHALAVGALLRPARQQLPWSGAQPLCLCGLAASSWRGTAHQPLTASRRLTAPAAAPHWEDLPAREITAVGRLLYDWRTSVVNLGAAKGVSGGAAQRGHVRHVATVARRCTPAARTVPLQNTAVSNNTLVTLDNGPAAEDDGVDQEGGGGDVAPRPRRTPGDTLRCTRGAQLGATDAAPTDAALVTPPVRVPARPL